LAGCGMRINLVADKSRIRIPGRIDLNKQLSANQVSAGLESVSQGFAFARRTAAASKRL
jgi:hypothetical protein